MLNYNVLSLHFFPLTCKPKTMTPHLVSKLQLKDMLLKSLEEINFQYENVALT